MTQSWSWWEQKEGVERPAASAADLDLRRPRPRRRSTLRPPRPFRARASQHEARRSSALSPSFCKRADADVQFLCRFAKTVDSRSGTFGSELSKSRSGTPGRRRHPSCRQGTSKSGLSCLLAKAMLELFRIEFNLKVLNVWVNTRHMGIFAYLVHIKLVVVLHSRYC